MNLTRCAPGFTGVLIFGVIPSGTLSRKQLDGGIELMFRNESPAGAVVAGGAAVVVAGGAAVGGAVGGGATVATTVAGGGTGAPFSESSTLNVFSAWPSSKLICCL